MIAATHGAVAGWFWTITTVAAALVTLVLIGILTAHNLVGTVSGSQARKRADGEDDLRRRLRRAAALLIGYFVLVVLMRFAIILAERPGP
jgi:hypothetical protein